MALNTLKDLLIEELQDIYSAEQQILKALPKMEAAATSPKLKAAFTKHLAETQGQVERLNQIFAQLKQEPGGKVCVATKGLVKEAKEMMEEKADTDVRDAALIASAQKIEHYEIANYGTTLCWATELGLTDIATLLETTLNEEKKTDQSLTKLAKSRINLEAISQ